MLGWAKIAIENQLKFRLAGLGVKMVFNQTQLFLLINSSTIFCKLIYINLKKYVNLQSLGQ
ncbi:unknown protein [Microcystis aeruginosa NIES-843]|uniref:Uncharacterized protein n=1 Tax=Microcystis aeruginosa (strain NIES-843 / IAM M-2473) TaxID=449447 RepID=B0JJZ7_MICAN|nr:unknown protein [Microcystis aeruginosa NIES-843]